MNSLDLTDGSYGKLKTSGWLTVIEKQGLHQTAEILENYGINSETDVSVLDRDDFCKLVSGGLSPLEAWASF
jgi:hypothetical protein